MRPTRWIALILGALLLAAARGWTLEQWQSTPFFGYGFTYFRNPGPGETGFLLRYLLSGSAAAALLAWGAAPWLGPRISRIRIDESRYRVLRLSAAIAAALLVAGVGWGILRDTVVTDDEYVYLFQSRILGLGRASLPAPPLADFLGNVFVAVHEGRWFGQYPPGHPLVLLPGVLLGIPRLVPVILAGLGLWLSLDVLRGIVGRGWALAGGAILLASPLFLLTGGTLLSHSTAYFALALAAHGLLGVWRGDRARDGLAAGFGLGLLFVTRPYTGATLGGVLGLVLLWGLFRRRRRRAQTPAILVLAAWAAFFLLYNLGATGDPLVTGYQAVRDPGHVELGFGVIAEGVAPHTPAQGLRNVGILAGRFHAWGLGWPLALLLPLFAIRARGSAAKGGGETEARDASLAAPSPAGAALLAAVLLVVGLGSYVAYWSLGVVDTGPVKTYELLLPLVLLTVIGARVAVRRLGRGLVAGWIAASILAGTLVFWPPMVGHLGNLTEGIGYPLRMVEETVERPALVFVQGMQPRPPRCWVYGRPNPRPDLSDPILYVRDGGPMNAAYWKLHPDRRAYRLAFIGATAVVTPLERPR